MVCGVKYVAVMIQLNMVIHVGLLLLLMIEIVFVVVIVVVGMEKEYIMVVGQAVNVIYVIVGVADLLDIKQLVKEKVV